jgi:hypothetical protein
MARLRHDLHCAFGCFSSVLQYAEWFVENAPVPRNFRGGRYLGAPSL